jgi:aspartyl aminopeptidase
MKAIKTNTSNRTYTGDGCNALPATAIQFADGKVATETSWELDETELEQLKKTGRIYVTFEGQTIIPFMVHANSNAEPPILDVVQ